MLNRYLLAPLAALLLLGAPRLAHAQTGGVRIGTAGTPDASAALDISSTSKGLLLPRLSTAQRDAIASPAVGLTVYNTTTNQLNTWDGTRWDTALSATPLTTLTYTYTGAPQTYTVPAGVTSIRFDARGGAGGASDNSRYGEASYAGGQGAQVKATLAVTPGQVFTFYVGGSGSTAPLNNNGQPGGGGYNGGGNGGQDGYAAAGGGGGATDVRTGGTGLADRLLAAAGGGGGGYPYNAPSALGGVGGAPTGGTGAGPGGAGATPTGGFALGQGGSFTAQYDLQAGGGGGYYGGQASTNYGGGGGGSSFVTATGSSGVLMTAGANAGNGVLVLTLNPNYAAPALDGTNFVNVPGDNLGNHTATQNLDLNTYQLVGNGGSTGLRIASTGAISMAGNATVNGQVGIGTAPAASAALDVSSTTKGLLPPRLTTTQRDAIAGPAAGLTVYNTTTKKLNTWDGTRWDEALSANQQTFQAGQAVGFGYTGGAQTYTVPAGVTSLQVDARGAQGGSSLNGQGGGGARVQATLGVTPGQVLQINIGGSGSYNFGRSEPGGFNGGGSGGFGASGGGATDIRTGSGQLTDRLLVAGGGGGAGAGYSGYGSTQGGAGGGPTGGNGTYTYPGGQPNTGGGGATQASGGSTGGVLGNGGGSNGTGVGGGGGGYYGGGAGSARGVTVSTPDGSGGGGSSWTTPSGSFAITMTAGYQSGNGELTLTPVVYPAPAINGANIVNVAGTWNVNGADVYRLSGNVGIGTSSPAATLDVSGSTSTVKLGGLAGTGTRMVTAAANGTLATAALPTDAQQLSISGSTLALTNGGSVTLPAGDNLGNHTATQNLSLGANLLTGNGGSTGLSVSSSGQVGIGTSGAATQKLEVAGSVKISGTGNGLTFPDGTTQTTASSSANLTGDVTSTGATTSYANVVPATKGGAGTVTGLLRANGSGLVSAATPGTDYAAATGSAAYIQNQAGTAQAASFNLTGTGTVGGLLTAGSAAVTGNATVSGNVGIGTTSAAPATQKLDVRGNVRLGDNGTGVGTGPALEWVGPGVTSDPVGIYRVNPAADQSELRVVVGDAADTNDKFVVGRMPGTSGEGGIPTGTFTPSFTVRSDGNVGIAGLAGTGTRIVTTDASGNLAAQALPTGDNLGNHTATQNLNLAGNLLVSGGSTGLAISSGGNVGIGTTAPVTQLANTADNVIGTDGNGTSTQALNWVSTTTGYAVGIGNTNPNTTGHGLAVKVVGTSATALDISQGSSMATPGTSLLRVNGNGNVGIGTTAAQPATQRLDVRGNVRLGDNSTSSPFGAGQVIEWVGPGFNTDPVGIYRVNTGTDASELRVVVGDLTDANDRFVVGRSTASAEGGIPLNIFTPSFMVNAAGNVGIGTTDARAGLHVDRPETPNSFALGVLLGGGSSGNPNIELRGDNKTPYIDFSENTTVDYTTRLRSINGVLTVEGGGTGGLLFNVNGAIRASNVTYTSDARFKTNVRPLSSALSSVLALRGVRYDWNALGVQHGGTAGAPQVGLLAQEVEKIYPELVATDKDGYKSVNYAQLTPVLIEALKEQQQQIEALKARAASAEAKAATATATLETFEARLRRLEAAGGSDLGGQARK